MAASGERPQVEFRGLKQRGEVLGAVLVLEGSSRALLSRASALTAMMTDRCMLVAVDGGLKTCRAARRRPDLFVGDGDSTRKVPSDVDAVVYNQDKDFSDLAGALREMRGRRVRVVAVAGLLGGRVDHEWANVLELSGAARHFAGMIAPTNRGTVLITGHGCRMATVRGRTFSLFAMGGAATVSLSGTRWELQRRRLRPGSVGLSNVTGTQLDLTVHAGAATLVMPARPRRKVTAATRPRG